MKRGETDAIVIKVEGCVVFTHKGISQNPEGTGAGIDVKSHKGRQTLRLALVFNNQDVV